MVAVPVTMDGTSSQIVQVILVSIETYLLHIIMKKSPFKELYCIVFFFWSTRDPQISWFLGLWGNHKMLGSWISGTFYVVEPKNGSKTFKSLILDQICITFFTFFLRKIQETCIDFFSQIKALTKYIFFPLQNHEIEGITNFEITKCGDPLAIKATEI